MLKGNLTPNKPVLTDYSKHLVSHPITSTTSVEKKPAGGGFPGPTSASKIEHPGVFSTKTTGCVISCSGGRTINLGNYESARVDVTISIPCDPELVHEAYDYGTKFVSDKIQEACEQVK